MEKFIIVNNDEKIYVRVEFNRVKNMISTTVLKNKATRFFSKNNAEKFLNTKIPSVVRDKYSVVKLD